MHDLFFLSCKYLLWTLTLMDCLWRRPAVHLYRHMVYAFCAFSWRFYAWSVKKGFLWTCLKPCLEIADVSISKHCTALLASMRLLALPYSCCEQKRHSCLPIWDIVEETPWFCLSDIDFDSTGPLKMKTKKQQQQQQQKKNKKKNKQKKNKQKKHVL